MATYNLGDLFVGKDGNISKIVDIERKNKVVTLEHWDGVTSRMQYSTLRKHYTPAEEVDTVVEVGPEVTPEEPALVQEETIAEEPKKKEKKIRGFSKAFEAELIQYVGTLEGVTAGPWKNTPNLFWVKFTKQTKTGKVKTPRLVEIRIGSDSYNIATADTEALGTPEKVTKYYLHNNFGKHSLDNDFYKKAIQAFI